MPEPPKAQPIKHDWYQTESHVCVTVLAKNLNPTNVSVDFSRTTVRLLKFPFSSNRLS